MKGMKSKCPTLCDSMDRSPPGSSVHGILGKNTGVGSHFLLQGIFPTQALNLGLRHCRRILYRLSLWGSPSVCSCSPLLHDAFYLALASALILSVVCMGRRCRETPPPVKPVLQCWRLQLLPAPLPF